MGFCGNVNWPRRPHDAARESLDVSNVSRVVFCGTHASSRCSPRTASQVIADLVRERGSVRGTRPRRGSSASPTRPSAATSPASRSRASSAALARRRRRRSARATRPNTSFRLREHAAGEARDRPAGRGARRRRQLDHPRLRDDHAVPGSRAAHGKRELVVVTTAVTNARRARRQPGHDGHHDRRRDPAQHVRGERPARRGDPPRASTSTRSSSRSTASRSRAA